MLLNRELPVDRALTEPALAGEALAQQRREGQRLLQEHRAKLARGGAYARMLETRARLPAFAMRDRVWAAIRDHQVVVISGDTGCGKTTQVPQIVLDALIESGEGGGVEMICTQPRRISAMAVADRVAAERGETIGRTVGYQIRLEAKRSSATRLLFCTTGVLLRRLQNDCLLRGVTHIFVDEIHERDINSDFLLILLRSVLEARPSLKVILMSATLNAALFAGYFKGCPVVEIPGRTHPVTALFLEDALQHTNYLIEESSEFSKRMADRKRARDAPPKPASGGGGGGKRDHKALVKGQAAEEEDRDMDVEAWRKALPKYSPNVWTSLARMSDEVINYELAALLIEYIGTSTSNDGAILVFLPGLAEITRLYEDLSDTAARSGLWVLPLHSNLSTDEQREVFNSPPPGMRKVVLATNVAETSITIDDVTVVIDTCRMKENRWDPLSGMSSLVEDWVSKASARQRKGRAGRVRQGVCYHLVTSRRFNKFLDYQVPEMLRVPLDSLILQIKMLGVDDPLMFLREAVEPPRPDAIEASLALLRRLGALDSAAADTLTPLGYHLATLPVDVRVGKMLIYGAIFSCLEPVLTMAAAMGFRSPFFCPIDKREEADKARKTFATAHSDLLTTLKAFDGWQAAKKVGRREQSEFCRQYFLSRTTLDMIEDMRDQFRQLLSAIGFVPDRSGSYRHRRSTNVAAGPLGSASAPPPPLPQLADGTRVRAKYYGDGGWYPGVILAQTGKGFYSVLFDGYEEDGAQETAPRDVNAIQGVATSASNIAGKDEAAASGAGAGPVAGGDPYNRNAGNVELLKAVITAGLYPNVITVDVGPPGGPKRAPKLLTRSGEVFLHPSCIDHQNEAALDSRMLVYYELVKTAKVYARDATTISPYALLLFGGTLRVEHAARRIVVDEWLSIDASPRTAVLVKQLREYMDGVLQRKIECPSAPASATDLRVYDGISLLLHTERQPEIPPSPSCSGSNSVNKQGARGGGGGRDSGGGGAGGSGGSSSGGGNGGGKRGQSRHGR